MITFRFWGKKVKKDGTRYPIYTSLEFNLGFFLCLLKYLAWELFLIFFESSAKNCT